MGASYSISMLMPRDEAILKKLDPPGKPISPLQFAMNRYVVKPWIVRKVTWEQSEASFQAAHAKLLQEFSQCSPEQLVRRELVPPQVGLEDSSRYWSLAMVARHLVIVGSGVEQAVILLSQGKEVPVKVDIAKVKPEEEKNEPSSIEAYREFGDGVLARISRAVKNRDSKTSLWHPWFGPLRSKDWFWLLGAHGFIHLKQSRNIRKAF